MRISAARCVCVLSDGGCHGGSLVEFQRVARAANPSGLIPRTMASQFSRKALILFSGPYARPDGLMAFLQRHGISVTPIDNDGDNGGDTADDILNNEVYEPLLRRIQRARGVCCAAL